MSIPFSFTSLQVVTKCWRSSVKSRQGVSRHVNIQMDFASGGALSERARRLTHFAFAKVFEASWSAVRRGRLLSISSSGQHSWCKFRPKLESSKQIWIVLTCWIPGGARERIHLTGVLVDGFSVADSSKSLSITSLSSSSSDSTTLDTFGPYISIPIPSRFPVLLVATLRIFWRRMDSHAFMAACIGVIIASWNGMEGTYICLVESIKIKICWAPKIASSFKSFLSLNSSVPQSGYQRHNSERKIGTQFYSSKAGRLSSPHTSSPQASKSIIRHYLLVLCYHKINNIANNETTIFMAVDSTKRKKGIRPVNTWSPSPIDNSKWQQVC